MFWRSAFLDFAPGRFDVGVEFWSHVTGHDVSPRRGERAEFTTLVPPRGDDYLRAQALAEGPGRIHLDLHVPDPLAAERRSVGLGGVVLNHSPHGYVVMSSPGGFVHCFVSHPAAERPSPTVWPGGHRSVVDQVCLDIPSRAYEAECAYWRDLTGEGLVPSASEEFRSLTRSPDQPLRLLLQRLGDEQADVTAHLDLASTDRPAEMDRHVELGARVVREHGAWTVLLDPTGAEYCITDRDPETGVLP